MAYWEAADQDSAFGTAGREFAEIWQALPKVVFSTTLESVKGSARLAYDSGPEEVRRLKEQVDGDLAVGGKMFFPSTHASLELELVETRSFASRVVYLRYQRSRRE